MSQDKDTDFDIPVFIAQPEKVDNLYDTILNNKSDKLYKLKDISVTKMYEYEVFTNSNKNYGLLILFLRISFEKKYNIINIIISKIRNIINIIFYRNILYINL